jgi:hypothetical protein
MSTPREDDPVTRVRPLLHSLRVARDLVARLDPSDLAAALDARDLAVLWTLQGFLGEAARIASTTGAGSASPHNVRGGTLGNGLVWMGMNRCALFLSRRRLPWRK